MLSIVVPAFNEEEAIGETIKQIEQAVSKFEHEVLVVDDGSQDTTAVTASIAGAHVIRHPHNLGYGAALMTGIRAATFDTIVITDADGTYPNEKIPLLLQEYNRGFNMVVGARTGAHYRESILKFPLRLILKWLVEFTTGRSIPDVNSGLRIFSKQEIMPYFNHLCLTFSFTTSLTLAYMMTGKFVTYVTIDYYERAGRTKVQLFRDTLRTLQYIVQTILYFNPLKMFLLICGFLLVGAAFCLVLAAFLKLASILYLGIGALLMAVHVFCLGLLAELLRQIMSINSGKETLTYKFSSDDNLEDSHWMGNDASTFSR